MIKLIIFDLDGVLIDARDIHYESLNRALEELEPTMVISRQDHISMYDGLSTSTKLRLLTKYKNLSTENYKHISELKQKFTIQLLESVIEKNQNLIDTFNNLKKDGYLLYVASNSVRQTVDVALRKTGILDLVDFHLSNEDVKNPKPNSEIYLKCMIQAGVSPKETLILEDSIHGRKAAIDAGALLYPVDRLQDVEYSKISVFLSDNKKKSVISKWKSNRMNVLIPMAGLGSRFQKAGYTFPKPLIEVKNKPMIQVVVENLNIDCKFIYIVQKNHYDKYNLNYLLKLLTPECEIVILDGITEGAACTTLLAKNFVNNEVPLLIVNSDQFIEWDSIDFYYKTFENVDGYILTFQSSHPKWSFVKLDDDGYVTQVAEKKPISDQATVGIYYWKRGRDYVNYAEKMISKNVRTNDEFYVAPVYNEAINDGLKIKTYPIKKMWGLGTPEDLGVFLNDDNNL